MQKPDLDQNQMHYSSDLDLLAALRGALKAARVGRIVLQNYFGNLRQVEEKFQAGLVSEADRQTEAMVFKSLREDFPNFDFLGEESSFGSKEKPKESSMPQWIVDPLDGTTNYIQGFHVYCCSIGLRYKGEALVGVIDLPALNETYWAVKGQGAFCNGKPIKIKDNRNFKSAVSATGFMNDFESLLQIQMKVFEEVLRKSHGVRRPGAACFDLVKVASGVFDGFWESHLSPWDTAAGEVIVREAGGQVITYRNENYSPFKNSIIAGTPDFCRNLVEIIQPHLTSEIE